MGMIINAAYSIITILHINRTLIITLKGKLAFLAFEIKAAVIVKLNKKLEVPQFPRTFGLKYTHMKPSSL